MGPEQIAEIMRRFNSTPGDRRRMLKWAMAGTGVTAGLAVLGRVCGPQSKIRSAAEIQSLIQKGTQMRTASDSEIFTTLPGVDLPFSRLDTVKEIRRLEDPVERTMAAIGFLDVENNRRYSNTDNGACNIYSLDILRLVLGNEAIGSRYHEGNGSPHVFGIRDADWEDAQKMRMLDAQYPFLGAFNLDRWMQDYGRCFGWKKVSSPAELEKLLRKGDHVALGVTKEDLINPRTGALGHAFVITGGVDSGYGLSQATYNIRYKQLSASDDKVQPGRFYNLHAHELTDF